MQKIVPHLWFNQEASEAANFYMKVFSSSRIIQRTQLEGTPSGTAELIYLQLAGLELMLISAGPYFKFNPSISLLIACETPEEAQGYWDRLIEGGSVLMPFDAYAFSEKYGWLEDRFGMTWQILCVEPSQIHQKLMPFMMFVGDQCGRAEEAAAFYASLFEASSLDQILRYGEGWPPNVPGTVQQMTFRLAGQQFGAMDSAYEHDFSFNEAVSLLVHCETQEEIDRLWEALSAVPEAEQCGWLKDRYGVSWQIVPSVMNTLMASEDPAQLARVTQAFLKMKKFDLNALLKASRG